jgi:hypothetical protein
MNNDPEHINVEFHSHANQLFFSHLKDFQAAVATCNRKSEEYLYQQIREKYLIALRQRMEVIARDLIYKHRSNQQLKQIDQNLNLFINDYVHRFITKIEAF